MTERVPLTLLALSVLAFACGPRSRSEGNTASAESTRRASAPVNADTPLAPSLDVRVDGRVEFRFAVTNEGKKKLELMFRDGQTHEVVVLDTLGREVWRWSDGRLFTQAIQNRVLRQSDQLRYAETWKDPAPGTYVAVARLEAMNHPVEERVRFTVRQ
jgi:hypothetical protein